jgi:hypothetical protein
VDILFESMLCVWQKEMICNCVVYDISSITTIRAVRGGSLMERLRLSMLKQDGLGGLHGLSHWGVIPYVHEEDCCIVVCVLQTSVELT